MKMNKRLEMIGAIILLVLIPAFEPAWAASWAKMVYDTKVSSQTRENFQKTVDTMYDLLEKYKIVISDPITVVVTADDDESYIRALMLYFNMSRDKAEHLIKAKGFSSGTKPVIVIRNRPELSAYYDKDARRYLTHELFHQVQSKNYSHTRLVKWLEEGSAELFSYMALEIAREGYVTTYVQYDEQIIRKAAEIPDTRQLAIYDNKTWISLIQQGYRVYPMATVMTYRLVGDDGFGKVILYYQLLDSGSDPDTAFNTAFGMPMSKFLADMNDYFNKLRRQKE